MTEAEVYVLSERALADVIAQIRPEQLEWETPEWFQTGRQGKVTLREIVNYHAYDTAWVPDVLAGRTAEEVGDRFEHYKTDSGVAEYMPLADAAVTAAESLDDPDRLTHLTYGDFPAHEYLRHITSFRGFRAYDIAKWIGAGTTLDEDLVQGMWDEFTPDIEQWRAMGVFGPAVPVPDDASLQQRLLGLAGRDPR